MTTNENELQAFQLWVYTTESAIQKAKKIAEKKRMTFRGYIGVALEKAIEADSDESNS